MRQRARLADRQGAFSGNRVERAIIDIGSNTVRLVLYGGSPRAPVTLFNEKVAARLGREIAETSLLAQEAIDLAMRGLKRYALLLRELKVAIVDVVATAAVREASNGPQFLADVKALGFAPRLLSGEDEAQISAMGRSGRISQCGRDCRRSRRRQSRTDPHCGRTDGRRYYASARNAPIA